MPLKKFAVTFCYEFVCIKIFNVNELCIDVYFLNCLPIYLTIYTWYVSTYTFYYYYF